MLSKTPPFQWPYMYPSQMTRASAQGALWFLLLIFYVMAGKKRHFGIPSFAWKARWQLSRSTTSQAAISVTTDYIYAKLKEKNRASSARSLTWRHKFLNTLNVPLTRKKSLNMHFHGPFSTGKRRLVTHFLIPQYLAFKYCFSKRHEYQESETMFNW